MAVIQPLYFPGGRYAASTDRKLLAALLPSEADGTRVSGVIPSYYGTKSMKVAANGTNMVLTIQPGICVIPDKATQSADSPGVYLGAIESSSESITIETNTTASVRTDSIYAVVDDTPYTITNKVLTSNVATLTTSSAHGFVVGQTVVVTGVDNTFDGSYVITVAAPASSTFSYAKTADNVTSTAVVANATANDATAAGTVLTATITKKKLLSNLATITTSAAHLLDVGSIVTVRGVDSVFDGSYEVATVTTSSPFTFTYVKVGRDVAETTILSSYSGSAVARVPFAIKIEKESGTTLGSKTKILLAKVAVPGSSASSIPIANVTDYRQYVTGLGGVHLYDTNSSATGPTGVDGRLRWQTNSTGPTGGVRKLEVYDGVDSAWRAIYDTAGNHHDDETTDASTTAIHHTIGTSATQAAAGNHAHDEDYAVNAAAVDASVPANTTTYTEAWSGKSVSGVQFTTGKSGKVLIILTAVIYTTTSGKTTNMSFGIKAGSSYPSSSTGNLSNPGSTINSISVYGNNSATGAVRCSVSYVASFAANTLHSGAFFYTNNDTVAVSVNDARVTVLNLP